MTNLTRAILFAALLWPLGVPQARAVTIVADATGYDGGFVPDFWGVQFTSGTGYIQTATFDITATGGYFDFDGSLFLGAPGVEPIIGATSGLSTSDISYPTAGGHPTTLTFTFAPNSFTAGDWFRFSADVDGAGGSITSSGGAFGALGASFQVLMSTGEVLSAPFVTLSADSSEAVISVDAVPLPAALPLYGTGLGLMGLFDWWRRRRVVAA
jgi:hypothetical protein